MREAGIRSKIQKKFKVTTDSNHAFPVADNVLNRELDSATGPNQLWVSDKQLKPPTDEGGRRMKAVVEKRKVFFATLKKELVHHKRYATREEAKQSIFEYIEVFYNRERLHSSLGYLSPEEFEKRGKA